MIISIIIRGIITVIIVVKSCISHSKSVVVWKMFEHQNAQKKVCE